jgi:hypothetical protein
MRGLHPGWWAPVALPCAARLGLALPAFRALGQWWTGVVYRAEDTALGRTVALKFLPPQIVHDPKQVQRFREEARTTNDPHIIPR